MLRSTRFLSLLLAALLCQGALAAPLHAGPGKARPARLKVLTYNLYVGGDMFRVFGPPACGVPQAVQDIYAAIEHNDFPARAQAIADQILAAEPHVVGLQEVSLIRTQVPGNALAPDGSGLVFLGDFPADPRFTFRLDAETVELDYLQLLLDALRARGLDYVVVEAASPTNVDAEFPALDFDASCHPIGLPIDLRLTDRDVLLVRSDLALSQATAKNFDVAAPIALPSYIPTPNGPMPATYVTEFQRGWGALVLRVKDRDYSIINTHLEVGDASLPPDQGLNAVQMAQAYELGLARTTFPAPRLLIGDINASPAAGDPRPAHAMLTGGFGMLDLWAASTLPVPGPGWTCCQAERLDQPESTLDERIDVLLLDAGDLVPRRIKVEVLGEAPEDRTPSGLWPSDHAGVAGQIDFER